MLMPLPQPSTDDRFGRFTECVARGMGTPGFLLGMTVFVVALARLEHVRARATLQFDPRAIDFTLLTLILSLQASYAAPLILLAQNRQDDRDRVQIEQDRQRAERNLADTEYLAREVVALRLADARTSRRRTSSAPSCAPLLEELDKHEERDEVAR